MTSVTKAFLPKTITDSPAHPKDATDTAPTAPAHPRDAPITYPELFPNQQRNQHQPPDLVSPGVVLSVIVYF
ncbi:Hypothetical predicted protein, partial [Paramuricea clavata]